MFFSSTESLGKGEVDRDDADADGDVREGDEKIIDPTGNQRGRWLKTR